MLAAAARPAIGRPPKAAAGPYLKVAESSGRLPYARGGRASWCHRWYHTSMDKTTVYLPLELKTALRRVAQARGVSEAEVIRTSILHEVERDRPRPQGGLFGGTMPVARDADAHLRGFGER